MRKAVIGMGAVIAIILFLVGSGILIPVAVKIAGKQSSEGAIETCRLSIIAAEASKTAKELTGLGGELECPVHEVEVKKKDVFKGGKFQEELAKSIIVKEMYDCARKTALGNHNPYAETLGADSVCLVCSELDFSAVAGESIHGLTLYQATHPVTRDKQTFSEFIGQPVDLDLVSKLKQYETSEVQGFSADDNYLVIWRVSKESLWDSLAIGAAGAATGVAVGIIVPGVGNLVGGVAGGLIGSVAGVYHYIANPQGFKTSDYLFVPEKILSLSIEQITGTQNLPDSLKDDKGEPLCEHTIWQS